MQQIRNLSTMKAKYRVCIAEDHAIVREGLRVLLESDEELEVVCEAIDGLELIQYAKSNMFDLILLDLSMPKLNGLESMREIKKRSPMLKFLILTMHNAEEYVLSALLAGANGYALKSASRAELILAIKSVLAGMFYISPGVSDTVVKGYMNGTKPSLGCSLIETLTHRERELLKLIAEGYKNRQIAEYLHISIKTVENHRSSLMRKLDLHNSAALTGYAIEKGLLN
jgi:DNA-binding NarL/FixJ family response regulator